MGQMWGCEDLEGSPMLPLTAAAPRSNHCGSLLMLPPFDEVAGMGTQRLTPCNTLRSHFVIESQSH